MTRSFPLAGRADGGNEKSRMTEKIFPYRHHRNPCGFLLSCGIRKTSLRQRLHSTATLFDCFQYIRNGRSSQDSKRKKCSCPRKIFRGTGVGLGFQSKSKHRFSASVCTLAEKRCLPYRSDLLISKHIRCGHTPEKWRSGLSAEAPFFYFGIVPNPVALYHHSLIFSEDGSFNHSSISIRSILKMTGRVPSLQQAIITFSSFVQPFIMEPP